MRLFHRLKPQLDSLRVVKPKHWWITHCRREIPPEATFYSSNSFNQGLWIYRTERLRVATQVSKVVLLMIGYLFGRLSRAILNEVPNRTPGFTCWVVQLWSAYLFGSIMNDVVVYHLNGVFICVYENGFYRYSDDWILFVTDDLCECVVFWRIGLVMQI